MCCSRGNNIRGVGSVRSPGVSSFLLLYETTAPFFCCVDFVSVSAIIEVLPYICGGGGRGSSWHLACRTRLGGRRRGAGGERKERVECIAERKRETV